MPQATNKVLRNMHVILSQRGNDGKATGGANTIQRKKLDGYVTGRDLYGLRKIQNQIFSRTEQRDVESSKFKDLLEPEFGNLQAMKAKVFSPTPGPVSKLFKGAISPIASMKNRCPSNINRQEQLSLSIDN